MLQHVNRPSAKIQLSFSSSMLQANQSGDYNHPLLCMCLFTQISKTKQKKHEEHKYGTLCMYTTQPNTHVNI